MNTTSKLPPPRIKRLTALAIVLAALTLFPLASVMAQTALDFSKNVDTTAVARNESQAIDRWGQRVCISVTLNADGMTGTASVGYGTTTLRDDDNDPNTPDVAVSGTENINTWLIVKDTAGYPGMRYKDFNGNNTNVFRGVTVEDGEDHIGNVYWTSTSSTTGTGTFKAMHPKGYKRMNELWVEIDTPEIKVNQYQSLGQGAIGTCGGYGQQ